MAGAWPKAASSATAPAEVMSFRIGFSSRVHRPPAAWRGAVRRSVLRIRCRCNRVHGEVVEKSSCRPGVATGSCTGGHNGGAGDANRESGASSAPSRWRSWPACRARRCRAPSPTAPASRTRPGARCCSAAERARLPRQPSGAQPDPGAERHRLPDRRRRRDALPGADARRADPAASGDRPGGDGDQHLGRERQRRGGAAPDDELPRRGDDRAVGHAAGGAGHHLPQQRPARDPDQPRRPLRRADQHRGRQCRGRPRGAAHAPSLRLPADRGGLLDRRHARASSPASAPSPPPRPGRARAAGGPRRADRLCGGVRGGAGAAQRLDAAGRGLLRHRPARLRLHGRRAPRVRASRCRPTSASSASTTSSRPAGPPTT